MVAYAFLFHLTTKFVKEGVFLKIMKIRQGEKAREAEVLQLVYRM
jgi:hypothetical protein